MTQELPDLVRDGHLDDGVLRNLLEENVLARHWPDGVITGLRRERQRFSPDKEFSLIVSLQLEGYGVPSESQRAVVSFLLPGDLRQADRGSRKHFGGSGGSVTIDHERGCVIELFPGDWRLPALRAALDPVVASDRLRALSPDTAFSLDIHLLRYRPHTRGLLAYRLQDDKGQPVVDAIAKVYASRGKAAASWAALESLTAQSGTRPIAPRPLLYDDEWRMVVMERVAGRALHALRLNALPEEALKATQLAARALVDFHACTLERKDTRTLADELVEIREQAAKFAPLAGWLSEAANAVVDEVEARASALPTPPLGPVHGSFKAEQVIVAADHAVIVDLDGCSLGDPAFDVGNYVAKDFKDARDPERADLEALGEAFLYSYVDLSDDPTIELRCRLFEAVSLTRLAFRELHTIRGDLVEAGDASPSGRLVGRAQQRLREMNAP